MLPILHLGLESPTHAIVDKSLGCLTTILSILDFSTIKNELFPVVASVFSKTGSLGIKVRGLEAFVILCGGINDETSDLGDDLDGAMAPSKKSKASSSAVLDKYTVQEKVVPLLKAMKTKEPAVMMAALAVFKQVGKLADVDFLAMEALPILWSFSLGPLLNLQQFQAFMDLIRTLSTRIEQEQIKKLREISTSASHAQDTARTNDLMSVGSTNGFFSNGNDDAGENDFERLVLGNNRSATGTDMLGDAMQPQAQPSQTPKSEPPMFSWSSPPINPNQKSNSIASITPQSRTITPDHSLSAFAPLHPSNNAPSTYPATMANGMSSFAPLQPAAPSAWPSMAAQQPAQQQRAFSLPPPPQQNQAGTGFSNFAIAPPPSNPQRPVIQGQLGSGSNLTNAPMQARPGPPHVTKSGLDAYQSLL